MEDMGYWVSLNFNQISLAPWLLSLAIQSTLVTVLHFRFVSSVKSVA